MIKITYKKLLESEQALVVLANTDFSTIKKSDVQEEFPDFSPSAITLEIRRKCKTLAPILEEAKEELKQIAKRISHNKTKILIENGKEIKHFDLTGVEDDYEFEKNQFLSSLVEINVNKIKYTTLGKVFTPIILHNLDYLIDFGEEDFKDQ